MGIVAVSSEKIRVLEWALGFLARSGRRVDELAARRRWRALFAFGDKGHVAELSAAIGGERELIFGGEANLVGTERTEVAKRALEAVERFNRRRELELVRTATGGERRPAARDRDRGVDDESAEQLIEAALQTGARVTPVGGEAAAALDEHGGVAALLRY